MPTPVSNGPLGQRSVGNIPVTRPKTNGTGGTGHNMAEFIDSSGAASSLEQQRQLEDVAELMLMKETNPAEFEQYIQMAADAAKLATEQPEVFASLVGGGGTGLDHDQGILGDKGKGALTPARVEQLRAMEAAAELTGTKIKGHEGKGEINIPGTGKTTDSGGVKTKTQGIMISPRPGFVIKSKVMGPGIKVFINICQHERIGKSEMIKKLDEEGNEVEGLNIPMSVGPPSVDKDNAGAECVVYDVIINPNAVEECKADKTGARRDWLCQLALQSVMRKHECRLDNKYKLPKLTFKGDKDAGPAQQRIRDDSGKPQIQEVAGNRSTGNSKAKGVAPSAQSGQQTATPSLTSLQSTVMAVSTDLDDEPCREENVTAMSLEDTVRTPWKAWPDKLVVAVAGLRPEGLCSEDLLAEVRVHTSAFECSVHARGHHPLQLRLPFAVLPGTASARTNAHEGTLTVILEVDKAPPESAADAGSKPWLLARALHNGEDRTAPKWTVTSSQGVDDNGEGVGEDDEVLPEDQFHLRLPKGVDQYTGAPLGERDDGQANLDGPIRESDLLPEERFHRADLISRHMIDTREKQRKDKIERADKEREERKKEGQHGVEYIDFDDYRPGGKLGPSAANPREEPSEEKTLEVPADCGSLLRMKEAGRVLERSLLTGAAEGKRELGAGTGLHAAHWSNLLD